MLGYPKLERLNCDLWWQYCSSNLLPNAVKEEHAKRQNKEDSINRLTRLWQLLNDFVRIVVDEVHLRTNCMSPCLFSLMTRSKGRLLNIRRCGSANSISPVSYVRPKAAKYNKTASNIKIHIHFITSGQTRKGRLLKRVSQNLWTVTMVKAEEIFYLKIYLIGSLWLNSLKSCSNGTTSVSLYVYNTQI